jgi:hypothetical protein
MLFFQVPSKSKDAQPPPALLQFAKSNAILGTKVTRTRAIVRFIEVRGGIDGGVYQLDRKFNCDATAGRDSLVSDLAHLAFLGTLGLESLGIWDLGFEIRDFQCTAHH